MCIFIKVGRHINDEERMIRIHFRGQSSNDKVLPHGWWCMMSLQSPIDHPFQLMIVLYWTFFSFVSCLWMYIFYFHVESLCFVRYLTNYMYIGLKLLIYLFYTIYSGKLWLEDKGAEQGHTKFSQDWHFTWWKMKWQQRLSRMCTYMYSHIQNTRSDYCGDRSVQFCDLSPYFD